MKDYGDVFGRVPEKFVGFEAYDVFPSETKGDGLPIKNNIKTGSRQGMGSSKRKVRCQICGFPVDINMVDHSGGSPEGDGAGGEIKTTEQQVEHNGFVYTIRNPDQEYIKGGGCPFCFSKHSSRITNK